MNAPKKIVIMPTFCEAHMIKCQIPNIIDTIDPDYIIYNEGMFPIGPENGTNVTDKFLLDYTLGGKQGFDFNELKTIVDEAQIKYPNTKIILNKMEYPKGMVDVIDCWYEACSNFSQFGIKIQKGDYIFPYEADVFHHEEAKNEIEGYMQQLQPNQGFRSKWIDFVENQNYAEKRTLKPFLLEDPGWEDQGRSRRICIKFGDWEWYKHVLKGLMTQQYPMLFPTDLVTYHYSWLRPGKYKNLRHDQLNRHPMYWKQYQNGVEKIYDYKYLDIDVRPSMGENAIESTHRYIRFFDINHPKHIKSHSCYSEITKEQKEKILTNKLRFVQ
tara:strand:+ start:107 stop:1087 length:981 start_codon:yes stop_codon:yes gene_type:complete